MTQQKKYPMIVNIYQIQSHTKPHSYQIPKIDDPLGFNIRFIATNPGYFKYFQTL